MPDQFHQTLWVALGTLVLISNPSNGNWRMDLGQKHTELMAGSGLALFSHLTPGLPGKTPGLHHKEDPVHSR